MSLVSLEEYIDELTNQTTEIRYQREPELLPQNYEKNLYSYGKFQPMETTNKTKIFRTYGRGKVEIGKGQSAYVPNTVPQKNVSNIFYC